MPRGIAGMAGLPGRARVTQILRRSGRVRDLRRAGRGWARRAVAVTAAAVISFTSVTVPAHAVTVVTIGSTSGIQVKMDQNGNMAVFKNNAAQFYANGNSTSNTAGSAIGTKWRIGTTNYTTNYLNSTSGNSATMGTSIGTLPTGTLTSGTDWVAVSWTKDNLAFTQRFTIEGEAIRQEWTLTNNTANAISGAKLFWGGDTYFAGSDSGFGGAEVDSNMIYTYKDATSGIMAIKGGDETPFTSYYAGSYSTGRTSVVNNNDIGASSVNATSVDQGVYVQWNLPTIAPGVTSAVKSSVLFLPSSQLTVIGDDVVTGAPGELIIHNFIVTNLDTTAASALTFTPASAHGWDVSVLTSPLPGTVASKKSTTVTVAVQIPDDATPGTDDVISFAARGVNGSSATISGTGSATTRVVVPEVTDEVDYLRGMAAIVGFPTAGTTLTATASWTLTGVGQSYAWFRNGSVIVGQTSDELGPAVTDTLQAGDVIRVEVTGTKAGYDAWVAIAAVEFVQPTVVGSATIDGLYFPGELLQGSVTWQQAGVATGTFRWEVNGHSAGTGTSLDTSGLSSGDVIWLRVTGTKTGYKAGTAEVAIRLTARAVTGSVAIVGPLYEGETLTALPSWNVGGVAVSYVWRVNGSPSGTGPTFATTGLHPSDRIEVTATGTKDGYTNGVAVRAVTLLSRPSEPVLPLAGSAWITGSAEVGSTLHADSAWNQSTDSLTYEWFVEAASQGTGATLDTSGLSAGDVVRLVATATKGAADETADATLTLIAEATDPEELVGAASITGMALVGQTLHAASSWNHTPDDIDYAWYVNGSKRHTGATFDTSGLSAGDTVTLEARATKADFSDGEAETEVTLAAPPVLPNPTLNGSVSIVGDLLPGNELTAESSWSSSPDQVTYDWYVNGDHAGSGATFDTTGVTGGSTVTVVATPVKAGYDVSEATDEVELLIPKLLGTVGISGLLLPGHVLTANDYWADEPDSVTYKWYVNDVKVGTGKTFDTTGRLGGDVVAVAVKAVRDGFSKGSARAEAQLLTQDLAGSLAVTGVLLPGYTLQGVVSLNDSADTEIYTWFVNGTQVQQSTKGDGGPGLVFDTAGLAGDDLIRLVVNASRAGWNPVELSWEGTLVNVHLEGVATITGSRVPGQTLTCGADWNETPDTVSYQWFKNGIVVSGATSPTLVLTPANWSTGNAVRCVVKATKLGHTDGEAAASTLIVDAEPDLAITTVSATSIELQSGGDMCINPVFRATNTGTGAAPTAQFQLTKNGSVVGTATAHAMAVGETYDYTAEYCATSGDITAGGFTMNVRLRNAGQDVVSSHPITVTITEKKATLEVQADVSELSPYPRAGETITYTWTYTNTGSVVLNVTDVIGTGTGTLGGSCDSIGTLAGGESCTVTAGRTLTQAQVNAGVATGGSGYSVTVVGTLSKSEHAPNVPIARHDEVTGSITPDTTGLSADYPQPGETIDYAFSYTNSGNTTLSGVQFAGAGYAGLSCTPAVGTNLAPGAGISCTASHALTVAEIKSGGVTASGTVTAEGAEGPVSVPFTSVTTLAAEPLAGLSWAKSASSTTSLATPVAGDPVSLGYEYTNAATAGRALGVAATLTKNGAVVSGSARDLGALAAGASGQGSFSPALTQDDIDAGSVTYTVEATWKDWDGAAHSQTLTWSIALTRSPAWTTAYELASVPTTVATTIPGALLGFGYELCNTGNTSLTSVGIADSVAGVTISWPGSTGTLLPGSCATATGDYPLTQADITGGYVDSEATLSADGMLDSVIPLRTSLLRQATVTVAQAADTSGLGTYPLANETIEWTVVVTNTGNVPVAAIELDAALLGVLGGCGSPFTLAPGASRTCTLTQSVTQAQVDAGTLTSVVVAAGLDQAATVTARDSDTVTLPHGGAVTVTDYAETARTGTVVTARVGITNDTNYTLHDVTAAGTECASGVTLAPGATVNCEKDYLVASGTRVHSIVFTALDPAGDDLAPEARVSLTGINPALLVRFDSFEASTVWFTLLNDGDTPLAAVTVAPGPCPALEALGAALGVGEQVACPVPYSTGDGLLTLSVAAEDPLGLRLGGSATVIAPAPAVQVQDVLIAAAEVTYVIANIGNVPVTLDATTGECSASSLGVGASTACSVGYDVDTDDAVELSVTATDAWHHEVAATLQVDLPNPAVRLSEEGITASSVEYLVTNTGDVEVIFVTTGSCDTTTLAVGGSVRCSLAYDYADPDVTIPVTAVDALGHSVSEELKIDTPTPGLGIAARVVGGQVVVTLSNAGDVELSIGSVGSAAAGPLAGLSCEASTIAVGAAVECSRSYDPAEGDVLTLAAAAADSLGHEVGASTVVDLPNPGVEVGLEEITATTVVYRVTNTGDTELAVTTAGRCEVTTLAAGESALCEVAYSFVAAAVTVSASGLDGFGHTVVAAVVVDTPTPGVSITASVTGGRVVATVTNTGDVRLVDVVVASAASGPLAGLACGAMAVEPGAALECSRSYDPFEADELALTVTAADGLAHQVTDSTVVDLPNPALVVTAGQVRAASVEYAITNTGDTPLEITTAGACDTTLLAAGETATCEIGYDYADEDLTVQADGVDGFGHSVSDSVVVDTPTPGIQVLVTQVLADTLRYLVSNTGDVALAITVPDHCGATMLAVGESTQCERRYSQVDADVTLRAEGVDAHGHLVSHAPVVDTPTPGLAVEARVEGSRLVVVVTNTGDSGLTGIVVTSAAAGPLAPLDCPAATLAPGASVECSRSYHPSEADAVVVTVTAGNDVGHSVNAVVELDLPNPAISITARMEGGRIVASVTNTGDQDLDGLFVMTTPRKDRSMLAAYPAPVALSCERGSLATGASVRCSRDLLRGETGAVDLVATAADVHAHVVVATAALTLPRLDAPDLTVPGTAVSGSGPGCWEPGCADEELAFTGARVEEFVLLALSAILLGLILLIARRRKDDEEGTRKTMS